MDQKFNNLINLIAKMRTYQKKYFTYRIKQDLETAKRYEREVDKILRIEFEARKTKQNEIF
jgi:hypothetical protein